MTTLVVAGEAWELPFAALTVRALAQHPPPDSSAAWSVVVPPELARLAGPPGNTDPAGPPGITVRVLGDEPHRFRSIDEIDADLRQRLGRWPAVRVPAGALGPPHDPGEPVHRPPRHRVHRRQRIGRADVWTVDAGTGYVDALLRTAPGRASGDQAPPVWEAYAPDRPVFVVNTNDFGERPPDRHDDYFVLASGLLGLKMVTDSDPAPGARLIMYDINPAQLAWSRFVVGHAGRIATFTELVDRFIAEHPGVSVRSPLPHEWANAAAQAAWYDQHRARIADLSCRLDLSWVRADLLNRPSDVLDLLASDRSAFFMYLDLFVVWRLADRPPSILRFPGPARSLESAVNARSSRATFLPGPGSEVLQLAGSPLLARSEEKPWHT